MIGGDRLTVYLLKSVPFPVWASTSEIRRQIPVKQSQIESGQRSESALALTAPSTLLVLRISQCWPEKFGSVEAD